MVHQNFFEFQPTKDLNRFLREYGQACLSNTTPPAPSGFVNVAWQTDSTGNMSAFVPSSALNPRGTWSSSVTYGIGDLVFFNGSSYLSLINSNLNNEPDDSPSDWQIIAQGGGDVETGTTLELPFYATTGTTLSPSSITTNSAKTALTVPAVLSAGTFVTDSTITADAVPGVTGIIQQSTVDNNIAGAGWSLGNSGGWTVSLNESLTSTIAQRGIAQNRSGLFQKHAIGDTAGIYSYTFADGGIAAASDEGVTAATLQSIENSTPFQGTVASTTGTGDQAPVFAYTTGQGWTTDGAFLLNITKGTISGNLNGASTGLLLNTGSGPASTYLNSLPVTGVTLPLSTAVGIATGAIAWPVVAANNPQVVTVTVTLVEIGGIKHLFTVNSPVWVAGSNYPEQSKIITAVDNGNGTQTLTLKLRNPNVEAILFQGGLVGQYISFDANLALSGMRSSYFAFGSLTGTDLIYGHQITGGLLNNVLPQLGSEAAQETGANAGFHLYPGAEVVANRDFGFNCTLEQNSVAWSVSDIVENPHYPGYGGSALFVVRTQYTPSNPGFGSATAYFNMDGPGTAGGNTFGIRLTNQYTASAYQGSGGPLLAPAGIGILGPFNNNILMSQAPDTGAIIAVLDNNAAASDPTHVIQLGFSSAGALDFINATSTWRVGGALDAQNGFLVDHVPGATGTFTTADSKTVTVVGGLILAIV